MNIYDYFSSTERAIRSNVKIGAVEEPLVCLASDDYNGLIRCRVYFWDGSFLDIYGVVSTGPGYPLRIHYAYAYLPEGNPVFRYDNAPHHPEIETHPHHKHVGTAVVASPEPTLSAILAKVETHLD